MATKLNLFKVTGHFVISWRDPEGEMQTCARHASTNRIVVSLQPLLFVERDGRIEMGMWSYDE
jgi:hypothetical protein